MEVAHRKRHGSPLPGFSTLRQFAAQHRGGALSSRGHLAWLAESGRRIGTTLDLERTAGEFAQFAVPRLADGVAVDLLDSVLRGEEGERWTGPGPPATRAMAVATVEELAHLQPDQVGELSALAEDHLPTRCLLRREPILLPRIRRGDYARIAPDAAGADMLRESGVRSYMAVPLVARGVLLGAADFIRTGGRPPFSPVDVALAVQLATQAAVFIDNARLYGREREHVVSLQRELLPHATPATPGVTVSSCYAPSTDPAGVGGDWFDVVALPGGRTALLVGDVMTHGLSAAATMGRLRSVARTLLALDIAPERVLARLDMAARDLEEDQVATCVCAVYDPAEATYTLARAGHPPPLLVAPDGEAGLVDAPAGAPLGAGVIPYEALRAPATPGSRLVLYTDGLIKSRTRDIDDQLDRLLAAASTMPRQELDSCALIDPGHAPAEDRFDEAVLVVAAAHPTSRNTEMNVWQLPADASAARAARELIRERLAHWSLSELTDASELVVSELVGNALRYGNGPGQLRLFRGDRLMMEVADTGPDSPHIQQATLTDEGGRGLQLVNAVCRRWGSCRTADGKIVWAELNIPAASQDS